MDQLRKLLFVERFAWWILWFQYKLRQRQRVYCQCTRCWYGQPHECLEESAVEITVSSRIKFDGGQRIVHHGSKLLFRLLGRGCDRWGSLKARRLKFCLTSRPRGYEAPKMRGPFTMSPVTWRVSIGFEDNFDVAWEGDGSTMWMGKSNENMHIAQMHIFFHGNFLRECEGMDMVCIMWMGKNDENMHSAQMHIFFHGNFLRECEGMDRVCIMWMGKNDENMHNA